MAVPWRAQAGGLPVLALKSSRYLALPLEGRGSARQPPYGAHHDGLQFLGAHDAPTRAPRRAVAVVHDGREEHPLLPAGRSRPFGLRHGFRRAGGFARPRARLAHRCSAGRSSARAPSIQSRPLGRGALDDEASCRFSSARREIPPGWSRDGPVRGTCRHHVAPPVGAASPSERPAAMMILVCGPRGSQAGSTSWKVVDATRRPMYRAHVGSQRLARTFPRLRSTREFYRTSRAWWVSCFPNGVSRNELCYCVLYTERIPDSIKNRYARGRNERMIRCGGPILAERRVLSPATGGRGDRGGHHRGFRRAGGAGSAAAGSATPCW